MVAYSLIYMKIKVCFGAISLLFVLLSMNLGAQTTEKSSPAGKTPPLPNKLHERVYLKSKGVGDFSSATMALYYWMEAQPGRKDLLDSLCLIYLARGMFGQSAAVAKEILKEQKDNLVVKEALAQSYEGLGAFISSYFLRLSVLYFYTKLLHCSIYLKISTLRSKI